MGKKRFNAGTRGDVVPQRDRPRDDQARAQGDDRLGLPAQRLGTARRALGSRADADGRRRRPASRRAGAAQVIHFINKPMPGGLPKTTARALLDIEDRNIVPIIRDPRASQRRVGGGVLLPGLRLGAAVLAGRARDAGDAVPRGRAVRAAAGLPVLRLSADAARASSTRPRRSSPTTACCSIASRTRSTISTSRR